MTSPRRAPADRVVLALTIIVALAAALRLATVDLQSFWIDEAATIRVIDGGLADVFSGVARYESTPPLYYLLAWPWAKVFGFGETGLRSLSALLGAGTVLVVSLTGWAIAGRRAGLYAGILAAANPLLFWYSQEARAYALLGLLAAASFLCLVRARRQEAHLGWLVSWAVASALAVATHYFAIFLVAVEAVVLLLSPLRRRRVLAASAAVGVAALALLPLALHQRGASRAEWIGELSLPARVAKVPTHFATGLGAPSAVLVAGLGCAVAAAAVLFIFRSGERAKVSAVAVALGVGLGATALPVLVALIGPDYVLTRNLISALPVLLVGVGVAFASLPPRAGVVAAGALSAVFLSGVVAVNASDDHQRPDWRTAAARLGPARQGHAVVVAPGVSRLALGVYRPSARRFPARGASVSEVDFVVLLVDERGRAESRFPGAGATRTRVPEHRAGRPGQDRRAEVRDRRGGAAQAARARGIDTRGQEKRGAAR